MAKNKKIDVVYLDMDGVITDFYIEVRDKIEDKHKWETEEFPKFIARDGFVNLPMMPDGALLIRFLRISKVEVIILTSAGGISGDAYESVKRQKETWLKNHNIDWSVIVVPSKGEKKKYATKHSLLIDDTESNVDDFKNAGGRAIHHHTALQTILKIDKKYNLERGE